MIEQVLSTLGVLIVAIIVGYFLSTRENLRVIIRDTTLAALLSTAILNSIWLQCETVRARGLVQELVRQSELNRQNTLDKVDKMIAKLRPGDPFENAIRQRRSTIERDMEVLLDGTVLLQDEQEVVSHWMDGVKDASISIDASNLVTPSYWQEGSRFSTVQSNLQSAAISRGVRIRRILLYAPTDKASIEQVKLLGEEQTAIGVTVRYLATDQAGGSPTALKSLSTLGGAMDMVIFDLSRILVTNTRPRDYTICNGRLTQVRPVVDTASQIFEEWWSIAKADI